MAPAPLELLALRGGKQLMASLAFAAAVGAQGTTIGGVFISQTFAAFAGSLVDNFLLFPRLFAPDPTEGQRLDSLKLQSSAEGSPVNRVWGTARVEASVIWMTGLKEVKDEEHGGGKGGSGGEFITYKYFASAAFGFGEGFDQKPFEEVEQLILDGKKFYNVAPDIDISDTTISASTFTSELYNGTTIEYLVLTSPNGGPDLSKLKSGKECVVDGFTTTAVANNGTWRVVSADFDLATGISTVQLQDDFNLTNFVDKGAGDTVEVFQEQPTHATAIIPTLRFHLGDANQRPDDVIEAFETGSVPAYRGLCYVVAENILLTEFGNRLPNVEGIVRATNDITAAGFFTAALKDAGYDASEIDVSGVTGNVRGYVVRGPQRTGSALQPPLVATDTLAQIDGTVLKLFNRTNAPTVTIQNDDLAAGVPGSRRPRPLMLEDDPEELLPKRVLVNYIDSGETYQQQQKRSQRGRSLTDGVDEFNIPVVMTGDEAQDLAERVFQSRLAARFKASFNATPNNMTILESTVVTFASEIYGQSWSILVDRVERGHNWLMRFEGRVHDAETLTQDSTAEGTQSTNPNSGRQKSSDTPPPLVTWHALDLPLLRDSDVMQPGFYVALMHADQRIPFGGAILYESTDDGTTYNKKHTLLREAVFGRVTTVPADMGNVDPAYWDETNTVRVQLDRVPEDGLAAITQDEAQNGRNLWLLGDELVNVATVTQVTSDPPVYDLSVMIRGRRNTEEHMTTHAVGERAVWLDGPGVEFVQMNLAALGNERHFKVVAHGGVLAETPGYAVTLSNGTIEPFGPSHVTGVWDGSNDTTISWQRRSRALARTLGQGTPLLEEVEAYEVDILDAPGGNVLRTLTDPTGTGSVEYTAAQKSTDGVGATDALDIEVFQISQWLGGRGKRTAVNLPYAT